jgi:hypothetical protein
MAKRVAGEQFYDTLQARIRPGKDDDLAEAIGNLPLCTDISDLTRTALRCWFGLVGQVQIPVTGSGVPPDNIAPRKPPEQKPEDGLILTRVTDTKDLDLSLNNLLDRYK